MLPLYDAAARPLRHGGKWYEARKILEMLKSDVKEP